MSYKRKGSKWYWTKHADPATGQQVRRSCTTKDMSAARMIEQDMIRRAALEKAGLANPFEDHHKRPLIEHVDDWRQALIDKGNTLLYANQSATRVGKLFDACKFSRWRDIKAGTVQR